MANPIYGTADRAYPIPGAMGKRLTGFVIRKDGMFLKGYHITGAEQEWTEDIRQAKRYCVPKMKEKILVNSNARDIARKLDGEILWLVNGVPEEPEVTRARQEKIFQTEHVHGFVLRSDGRYVMDRSSGKTKYTLRLCDALVYRIPTGQKKNYALEKVAALIGAEILEVKDGKLVTGEPQEEAKFMPEPQPEPEAEESNPKWNGCRFFITKLQEHKQEYYLRSAVIDKNKCKCYTWTPRWGDAVKYKEYGKAKRIAEQAHGELWVEHKDGSKEKAI